MNPQFPVYIVSKGRADTRLTDKYLTLIGVPHFVVIESQEFDAYASVMAEEQILVLDPEYQRTYDTFDDLGDTKGKGPGPARNFVWQHSLDAGADWHWVMDDNIRLFARLNHNLKVRVSDGAMFRAMETFCLRYENVTMAGPQYWMFAPRKTAIPPFILNTRIYSCNLIRNDSEFRWRGRYNEDTDLSLRMLKAGHVTVQFNAFLQEKMPTQYVKGGNSKEFYDEEGTLPKSRMQVAMHPDVSKIVWKFGRWHHEVNYRPFKKNRLVRKAGVTVEPQINNFGMRLEQLDTKS